MQVTQNIPAQKRIVELDALRGLAAMAVVIFHFTLRWPDVKYGPKFGVTGVDLFFMISGFVILLTLSKMDTLSHFIVNRLSRLYPTYWVCVSITTLAVVVAKGPADGIVIKYLANMTMFQKYFKQADIDGAYWTMLVEMLFYIYMVIIFKLRLLKYIEPASLLVLLVLFICKVLFMYVPAPGFYIFLTEKVILIHHFQLFCAGILFYKLFCEGATPLRHAGLLACFAFSILVFPDSGNARFYITRVEYSAALSVYFILFYLFVYGRLKFIVTKPTLFLGKLSYSLYLIHQTLGVYLILVLSAHINRYIATAVALVFVVTLAYCIHKFVELPATKIIRKKVFGSS